MKALLGRRQLLVGATIATAITFPLTNALSASHGYWLHWRNQDTFETLGTWLLLLLAVYASLRIANVFAWPIVCELLHLAWLLVGGFFVTGALVKVGPIYQFALQHRAIAPWLLAGVTAAVAGLLTAALIFRDRWGDRPVERAVSLLWPLTFVFFYQLAGAQLHHLEPGRLDATSMAPAGVASAAPRLAPREPRVRTLVLLFDELSADYLYGAQAQGLDDLPALKRLVDHSTVYLDAHLPGGGTESAIPALFGAPQRVSTDAPSAPDRSGRPPTSTTTDIGWLSRARAENLDVRAFGWYLDYCATFAAIANSCEAVSLYNGRTLGAGFSVLHPLWTVLNLLPADLPFGFLKVPAAVRLHESTRARAAAWMHLQLADPRADIVYIHVNLPHVPFLDNGLTVSERFIVTQERYRIQLQQVDAFVAEALAGAQRVDGPVPRTRLIMLSDHNARKLTPLSAHETIVFLVHNPGQTDRRRIERKVQAVDVLGLWLFQPRHFD